MQKGFRLGHVLEIQYFYPVNVESVFFGRTEPFNHSYWIPVFVVSALKEPGAITLHKTQFCVCVTTKGDSHCWNTRANASQRTFMRKIAK